MQERVMWEPFGTMNDWELTAYWWRIMPSALEEISWRENVLFSLSLCFLLLLILSPLSSLPARGIQSDLDPKWFSACRFSASCCHGTVQSDLLFQFVEENRDSISKASFSLLTTSTGLLAGRVPHFLPHPWCCSYTQTAFYFRDRQVTLVLEENLAPSTALLLSSFEERLGCFWKALLSLLPINFLHVLLVSPKFLLGGYCMDCRSFSRCQLTGCH